jgi:bifunctional non-homologous end joining protein LigD
VGFGALLLGFYTGKDLVYCGRVGTGFTSTSLRQIQAELAKRAVDSPPFVNPPTATSRRGVTWVRPELVAEVEFTEWTNDGQLRHPSFQGLREDKPAQSVVREEPGMNGRSSQRSRKRKPAGRSTASPKPGKARTAKPADADTTVAGVTITHPDRVVYPEAKLTKLDIARYYERVADWILPHLVERPLTLVRCPDGPGGECFYQKHLTGSMPNALRGVKIQEKSKREEFIVVDDREGLIALVQMGVFEFHPWQARADDIERPDRIVLDLDPGEGVTWKSVIEAARDLRELLAELELTSFVRTSGGKGLHVVVPLSRRNSWDQLKAFAKGVADTMAAQWPDRYLATMSKAERKGKVYVDYLRNQRGATAIASYSTRARPNAPVATPLSWEELSARIQADAFRVSNIFKRLDLLKADPWKDFFTTKQSLTAKLLAAK